MNSDSDFSFIENEDKTQWFRKLQNLLALEMFGESHVTVEKMLNMLQSIKLRHNFSKKVVNTLIEYTKILAGPRFINLKISPYHVSKFNKPIKDVKYYTFYCPKCATIMRELLKKSELSSKKIEQCYKCSQKYVISTSNRYHFVNLDLEHQLKSILNDQKVLKSVVENFMYAQDQKHVNNCIRDV